MSIEEISSETPAMEEPHREFSHHEHHEHEHHEHHEEHHHHHHRHHRRKKRKRAKLVLPRFLKNKKFCLNMAIIAALILFLVILAIAAGKQERVRQAAEGAQTAQSAKTPSAAGTISIDVPFYDEPVYLTDEPALAIVRSGAEVPIRQVLQEYWKSGQRLDRGFSVELSYDIKGLPADCAVVGAAVEVCERSSIAKPRVFTLTAGQQRLPVPHLKTGTQYDYNITVTLTNGMETSVQGSFQTAETPRILSIKGAVNVRDIGGWKTTDGKTIRQGLLYRGSELDGAVEPDFSITGEGLDDMLSVFGIRTDLDLRTAAENKYGVDALGPDVEHIYFHMPMYNNIFTDEGKERIRELFGWLAKESTYPAYMHCTYGVDRTGTVCYLLEAMLGMDEEDLQREYRLSALYYGDVSDAFANLLTALDAYAGDTVQEKTENYLRSAGVTDQQMEAIRQILLV